MSKLSKQSKIYLLIAIIVVAALIIGGFGIINAGRARVQGYSGAIELLAEKLDEGGFFLSITKHSEGYGIGDLALERIVDKINENQNLDVDLISGATETSEATVRCARRALKSAGIKVTELPESDDQINKDEYVDYNCDVVVVGAGGAGLTAAIAAANNGSNVVLVEKSGIAGGNTVRSYGMIMAAGTELQAYNGVRDSSASFAAFLNDCADSTVPQNRIVSLADYSSENLRYLKSLGVKISDNLTTAGDDLTERVHLIINNKKDATGGALIRPLVDEAKNAGVKIIYDSEVYEFVRNMMGEILGVRAKQPDGDILTIWANSTVLATGGYDRSSVLIADYNESKATPVYSYSAPTNTGEAIKLAQQAGAKILNGSLIAELYDFYSDSNNSKGLLVTPTGERFVNEAFSTFTQGSAIQQAGFGKAYLITDKSGYEKSFENGIENGAAVTADSIEELGKKINAPSLSSTVKNYNNTCTVELDGEFEKDAKYLNKIDNAPYYAIEYGLKSYGTLGGIRTNNSGQAQSSIGAVPGLFACGEVANGSYFSGRFPGFGSSLTQIIETGRIAGKSASEYAKEDRQQEVVFSN